MSDAVRVSPPEPARYAKVLFAATGLLVFSVLFVAPRPRLWLILVAGWCASYALAHFAWAYRRAARGKLERAPLAQGRIAERLDGDGTFSFVMPAAGTEPWASDAIIVWVATAAVASAGVLLDSVDRLLPGFLATMLAVLGLRLHSAPSDRLRLEVSTRGWSVDALVAGRVIQRSGLGALLPELVSDGLVLWSLDGRVGVLRGELEPEERAWLGERLTALVAKSSVVAAEANGEVHQREPDSEGQEEQAESRD
jgi:hypothetical protein